MDGTAGGGGGGSAAKPAPPDPRLRLSPAISSGMWALSHATDKHLPPIGPRSPTGPAGGQTFEPSSSQCPRGRCRPSRRRRPGRSRHPRRHGPPRRAPSSPSSETASTLRDVPRVAISSTACSSGESTVGVHGDPLERHVHKAAELVGVRLWAGFKGNRGRGSEGRGRRRAGYAHLDQEPTSARPPHADTGARSCGTDPPSTPPAVDRTDRCEPRLDRGEQLPVQLTQRQAPTIEPPLALVELVDLGPCQPPGIGVGRWAANAKPRLLIPLMHACAHREQLGADTCLGTKLPSDSARHRQPDKRRPLRGNSRVETETGHPDRWHKLPAAASRDFTAPTPAHARSLRVPVPRFHADGPGAAPRRAWNSAEAPSGRSISAAIDTGGRRAAADRQTRS